MKFTKSKKLNKKITILIIAGTALLVLAIFQYWLNYNSASAKLARLVKAAPEIKKQYQLDKLSLVLPAKDENSVQVAVGDPGAKTFTPDLTLSRWDGEVKMTIKPDEEPSSVNSDKVSDSQLGVGHLGLKFEGDKIKFETPKVGYHLYELPTDEKNTEGGYEFEVILKEKPASNKIEFTLETQNLDFFYQPPLTQEFKNGYSEKFQKEMVVSETQVKDLDGNVLVNRPENVVGSYAVYYKNHPANIEGGKLYKTGQFGMIYRPKITDAEGNWAWEELNIDKETGLLTITIPQEFLDKAVYPISSKGLTFGYITKGETSEMFTMHIGSMNYSYRIGEASTASQDGTITDLNAALLDNGTPVDTPTTIFVNEKDSQGADSHGLIGSGEATLNYPDTADWRQISGLSIDITSGHTYILSISANAVNVPNFSWIYVMYNSVTSEAYYSESFLNNDANTAYSNSKENPWTYASAGATKRYSIYATYTGCGDYVCNGLETCSSCSQDCGGCAPANANVYYSVGQNTDDHKTGSPTVTIASGVATFSVAQTATNLGVGDKITYGGSVAYISGKQSTTVWNVITALGGGPPATTTAPVTSIAHAYFSLYNAIGNGVAGNATSTDHLNTSDLTSGTGHVLNIPCYYDSGPDTTAVTVSGYTTGANNYIKIYTPNNTSTEVNQSQRHNGKAKSGSNYTGYAMTTTDFWITLISINIDYVYVTGIIFDLGGDNLPTSAIGGGNYIYYIDSSIAFNGINENSSGFYGGHIRNSLVYDVAGAGITIPGNWNANPYVYNNTVYNCGKGFARSGGNDPLAKNNLSYNNTDNWNGAFDSNSDYNLSGPTQTDAPGSNSRNGVTVTFVDAANKDFHLASSDKGAKDKGTDLSATFTTDIDGQTRVTNATWGFKWDIGADEVTPRITGINTPLSGRFKDSSLVGYWSFDGPSMNSGQALDSSGNNNTGTLYGGVKKVPGISGQALSFDGSDDTITAGDIAAVDSATALTGCAWVKHSTITTDDVIMAKNNASTDGFQFFRDDTGASSGRTDTYTISVFDSADTDSATLEGATGASPLNSWTQVCFTFQSSSATGLRLYVNGNEDANGPISVSKIGAIDAGANVFRIGTLSDGTSNPFDGLIDEVRIYNRALSVAEVQEQYRAGLARLKVNTPITNSLTSGLVGSWTFNGQDINGVTAYDRSGSSPANNGTISGATPAIGKVGQALSFDGVDDYVTVIDSNQILAPDALTFAAWVKILPGWNQYDRIVTKKGSLAYNGSGWSLEIDSTTHLTFLGSGGTFGASLDVTWAENEWFYLVITKVAGATTVNAYKNGSYVANQPCDTIAQNTEPLTLAYYPNASSYTPIVLDEVRVYNRALSASEIQQLYNIGARKTKMEQ